MASTRSLPLLSALLLLAACGGAADAPDAGHDASPADAPASAPRRLPTRHAPPGSEGSTPRLISDLSGPGWTLWLDDDAPWEDDVLHAPPVDVAALPVRPPSAGWEVLSDDDHARPVHVPSTVETWTWDERGDHRGVSWWRRTFEVPAGAAGRRVVLAFAGVRLRAEVFVDRQLVGYDAVGHSPFEVDITDAVRPGGSHELAVRITDPGGNLDWIDHSVHHWGDQPIPPSHGFGGITAPVELVVRDGVHVSDLWVANTPDPRRVRVTVSVARGPGDDGDRDLEVLLLDAEGRELARRQDRVRFEGDTLGLERRFEFHLPQARLWQLDDPALHWCTARLLPAADDPATTDDAAPRDAASVRFGFRSFTVEGVGEDARFRLNGERIVLTSAISWGFWPVTGSVPDATLARRQVESARALGLNMLNHHRAPPAPGLLDVHDELGLLAYSEPGGHWCQGGDALTFALAREKWLRLVRRDRSHPSLVIRNLINEATVEPDQRLRDDLAAGQRADPSRVLTFTSAWDDRFGAGTGLHYRPWDDEPHEQGWSDVHDAAGPGVDRDRFYVSSADHRAFSDDREQIVFLGEEGAIGTPPRLEALAADVRAADAAGRPRGWDGSHWLARRQAIATFLERFHWRWHFAEVDAFTSALADVAYDFHARAVENARMGDVIDGYVINGWEEMRFENHSGIVDVARRPKGSVATLARALAPERLVVRLPRRVREGSRAPRPGTTTTINLRPDVYLIDETERSGPHLLTVRWEAPDRQTPLAGDERLVEVSGGDVFGELLVEGERIRQTAGEPGDGRHMRVVARLYAADADPAVDPPLLEGHEDVFLVDWRHPPPAGGALLTGNDLIATFWRNVFRAEVPSLADRTGEPDERTGVLPAAGLVLRESGPVDWLLVSDVDPEPRRPISALFVPTTERRIDPQPGVLTSWFPRHDLSGPPTTVVTPGLGADVPAEGPVPGIGGLQYGLRQEAWLHVRETGDHRLHVGSAGGVRVWLDDQLVLDAWDEDTEGLRSSATVSLEAESSVRVRLEHRHFGAHRRVDVSWSTPSDLAPGRALAAELLRRVEDDGTTLLVLDQTDRWARALHDAGDIGYRGTLVMGRYWMGGGFVARPHPALGGLVPEATALGMPFQELVHYGRVRDGLLLSEDAEVLVACVSDHQPRVGAAVSLLRRGAGRILLCTLDVPGALDTPPGAGGTARELLANLVRWAAADDDG